MQTPFLEMFKYNVCRDFRPDTDKVPKLMLTVLNGGKEMGSKVKFSKFYLVFNVKPEDMDTLDVHEAYFKLCASIEKSISATKVGLAGFKRQVDGSYFNAFDNINDSFKLLEEAINQTGLQQFIKIGINTDASNWFNTETCLYEGDGPKDFKNSD